MVEATPEHASLMELALAIAPRARIESIRLANSTIRSKLDMASGPLKADYGFDAITTIDHEHNKIIVSASLETCGKNDLQSDTDSNNPMSIRAEFVLVYAVDSLDEITEENARAFGRINGIHNAWPYWREYVQSTTVRLGLPALTLPAVTGSSLQDYYTSKATAKQESNSEDNASHD